MLKKTIALLLVVLCFTTTAFAEGKLKATEKTFIVCDTRGYLFAKVENVGDAPVTTGSGDLVVFDEDDEIICSSSYVTTYPSGVILEPGEFLYLQEYIWENALKETPVGDYKFSIPAGNRGDTIVRIPCEAEVVMDSKNYSYDNNIFVTFTNTSEEPRYDFYLSVAMYDAEGNLIYADADKLGDVAVHPGSTVTAKMYIDSDVVTYLTDNKITPATISAVVFYVEE